MNRRTYLDRRFPVPPVFQDVAQRWCADQSRLLLDLVWRGYDLLVQKDLQQVPFSRSDEAKEESLNYLLAGRVNQCRNGDEPFWFPPQPPETTKRKRGKGKSPTPDHGFVYYDHPRTVWPVEGKVLQHERDLRAYRSEIDDNFLTGRYAAFSREGAMLGYLLAGQPTAAIEEIRRHLAVPLTPHAHFRNRPHHVSVHTRIGSASSQLPAEFTCNHMILSIPTSS